MIDTPHSVAPPLADVAYRALRDAILSGQIPPGTKLKIEELQRRYSLSSSPLREALNRLTGEGYVIADQRRGFRAARISRGDLDDITKFRLVIEVQAFIESVERGASDWERNIQEALTQLEYAAQRSAPESPGLSTHWIQKHKEFHMALVAACSSRRQIETCSSLFDQSQRYRNIAARHRVSARSGGAEHKRILQAALDRDKRAAGTLLYEHIQKTAQYVSRFLLEE